ncbi:MFS transporter [Pseudonocardia broussonetiae]|uniref:MFS transporter n=1 Tax=Pseudonocardia broussonetiae TaxID=2736640 RepID=A0A6M6JBY1_9PSEU|nr:MFS transporter [Pseudonocardia broussonetiae]QJY45444.1 MFS transporter [Pseudonocardia broussonetiae]
MVTTTPGGLAGFRTVLAIPGVAPLMALALVARIPASAAAITLTLHVVLTLDLGYAAAGAVGAASTIGMAVAAPLLGRVVDRRGLRPVLVLTSASAAVFWGVAHLLSYPALLVGALLAGVLGMPVYSVIRQSLAAMVPEEHRRPAFSLDSMSVEVSYIVGPALGSLLVIGLGSTAATWAVGAGWVASGIAFWVLDPRTRAGSAEDDGPPPSVRTWLDRRLLGALLATSAAVLVVFGTELSVIASVQATGPVYAIALVNAVWCLASIVGGFLYGAARRSYPVFALVALLGLATLPVALGGVWWSFALLLVPAGLMCAPALAATSEAVSRLAPEAARGVVTGLHGSAITLGAAAGTPLAGVLVDVTGPAVAVVAVGTLGVAAAGVAALLAGARTTEPPHPGVAAAPTV